MGATLTRHLLPSEFVIHAHPRPSSSRAARLHWPVQSVSTVSLHARPVELLHPHLLPGNKVLALTSDHTTIDLALELLVNRGYGRSIVTALENLGGPEETRSTTAERREFRHARDRGFLCPRHRLRARFHRAALAPAARACPTRPSSPVAS